VLVVAVPAAARRTAAVCTAVHSAPSPSPGAGSLAGPWGREFHRSKNRSICGRRRAFKPAFQVVPGRPVADRSVSYGIMFHSRQPAA
jgi:hypothetical protein